MRLPALVLCCALAAGCAPSALSSARSQIAAGNFMAARRELVALSDRKDLSSSERREVRDNLCLSDFMIGRPTVSLAEQRRTCAAAMAEPGTQSGTITVQLDEQIERIDAVQVEAAIGDGDLPGAERAAMDYQSIPGADPALLAHWSKQVWSLADEQALSDTRARKSALDATISELRKSHADVRHMNDAQFRQWVEHTATTSGTPLAAGLELKNSKLKLSIDSANLQLAALNLDKLATINDAFAARCGCDAHTDVAVVQSGFPAYIVRLDVETRMSEVMILPRSDQQILTTSAN